MSEIANLFEGNEAAQPLTSAIETIMEIPDENLTDETMEVITGAFNGALTGSIREKIITDLIADFEERGLTKLMVETENNEIHEEFNKFLTELKPSAKKEQLLRSIFDILLGFYDEALTRYHNYTITLPLTVAEGAHVPTYAHEGDAAADLYALEDHVVPAHSYGNMIHTGVNIQLPENWLALILPRSSIGTKTPLRLSNSVGLIDSGYRGELCVLYDNTSDNDYTIRAGDRIAQLLVKPSYRFQPKVVFSLEDSDRGTGGFGASGK